MYGDLPEDLGLVEMGPTEMMFWLYCPISVPGYGLVFLPDNLRQFYPIINAVKQRDHDAFEDGYVYLTAKTLWVSGECIGNRPGWHSDGFGTSDVNYIWYDRAPTEFIAGEFPLPADCVESMREMERVAQGREIITYPAKHLLRLNESVIHRCPVGFQAGMRTFVKVSVSTEQYNLLGNSVNHELAKHMAGEPWDYVPRRAERNHPVYRGSRP